MMTSPVGQGFRFKLSSSPVRRCVLGPTCNRVPQFVQAKSPGRLIRPQVAQTSPLLDSLPSFPSFGSGLGSFPNSVLDDPSLDINQPRCGVVVKDNLLDFNLIIR